MIIAANSHQSREIVGRTHWKPEISSPKCLLAYKRDVIIEQYFAHLRMDGLSIKSIKNPFLITYQGVNASSRIEYFVRFAKLKENMS